MALSLTWREKLLFGQKAETSFLRFPISWFRWLLARVWHLCPLCLGVTPRAAGAVKLHTVSYLDILYLDLGGDKDLIQSRQYIVFLLWRLQLQ